MITVEDFEVFVRRSLTGVVGVIDRLDDIQINTPPASTGGSSPFGLVTHMLGACSWWVNHIVLGDAVDRDRDAEFTASGTTVELREAVVSWMAQLHEQLPRLASVTEVAGLPSTQVPLIGDWTVGACLLHVYEEVAQHLGHLEVTADLLLAET